MHELRQGPGAGRRAVQGVGDEPAHIGAPQGSQCDLVHRRLGRVEHLPCLPERVRGTDFVVAVGTDQ